MKSFYMLSIHTSTYTPDSTRNFTAQKRECIGTKYYQRQMLGWHKELTPEELPEVLFQTYIYRLVNKKLTFQRFGRIWHKVLPEADARAA